MDRLEELIEKFNKNDAMLAELWRIEVESPDDLYYCNGDPDQFARDLSLGLQDIMAEQREINKELSKLGVITKTINPLSKKWWFETENERP